MLSYFVVTKLTKIDFQVKLKLNLVKHFGRKIKLKMFL